MSYDNSLPCTHFLKKALAKPIASAFLAEAVMDPLNDLSDAELDIVITELDLPSVYTHAYNRMREIECAEPAEPGSKEFYEYFYLYAFTDKYDLENGTW